MIEPPCEIEQERAHTLTRSTQPEDEHPPLQPIDRCARCFADLSRDARIRIREPLDEGSRVASDRRIVHAGFEREAMPPVLPEAEQIVRKQKVDDPTMPARGHGTLANG